jgi:DNA repair protein RadC
VYDDATSDERPRERLFYDGVDRVSDAELIALVLGHGTRRHPALAVAEGVLRTIGGLAPLARASPNELIGIDGVGLAQAARLVAAIHLGRRAIERACARVPFVGSPEAVWRRLRPRICGLNQEVFLVIAVNARGVIVDEVEVARGTLARVDVHPRDVFRPLIRVSAAYGVVAHNHPSGDVSPSPDDLAITERLRDAGDLIGIPIVDHIIMTEEDYRSINEYLPPETAARFLSD